VFGFDFSTGVSTSPPRAVAILTRAHFHKVSRAAGPQQTGVQNAKETNFRTKVSGIPRDLKKCFGAGAEQQAIDELFVL
jgi:hypothetical protein